MLYMYILQFDLFDKGSDVPVWYYWFKNCPEGTGAQVPRNLEYKMALKVVMLDVNQKI